MTPSSAWLDMAMRTTLGGGAGRFTIDVALKVEQGSFTAIVGPSGAGKTTLLRLLAGLVAPRQGHLRVGGSVWCDTDAGTHVLTRHRPLGFMFQDYALFPNMTVRGNVEYALGGSTRPDEVDSLLRLVGLEGLQLAFPARLSGGQKQRLALIRALARRPVVLMLDEPLSALDPVMRRQLQGELKRLHAAFATTTFLVSHDSAEILRLADRVVRLDDGRIVSDGSPAQAFGADELGDGIRFFGEHLEGPDEHGWASVLIEGRPRRVRYRNRSAVAPGDAVMLRADDVESTPVV
jgi:molybdate transport system ATP-binding protein